MRDRDPRRLRLGGWRRRSRRRAGWWQASDGNWYPPSLAWHPAAQHEPAAPRGRPPKPITFIGAFIGWMWVILLVPVVLAVVLIAAGLVTPTPTDTVETFGPADGDPADVTDGRDGSGSATTTSTASTSTTSTTSTSVAPVTSRADGPSMSAPPTGTPPGDPPPARSADQPASPGDRPKTPGSADDCRDGGWQGLVDHDGRPFENQGDCVSYVNRLHYD